MSSAADCALDPIATYLESIRRSSVSFPGTQSTKEAGHILQPSTPAFNGGDPLNGCKLTTHPLIPNIRI
eukprot:COSAG06_NODE_6266_length_3005_cov_2.327598_4_plen_69_part_00